MDRDPHFQELLMRRGRMKAIANALNISAAAVCRWRRIPAERVPAISAALGLSFHELRPDLWSPPAESEPGQ